MKTPQRKRKPFESNLPMPLGELTAHARKLAVLINAHGTRMSRLSGDRISSKTAKQLVQLVEELEKIDAERDRTAVGNVREILREAQDIVTTITMAARFIGKDDPKLREQLHRIRTLSKPRRSTAHIMGMLDEHLALVEVTADLRKLLPKTLRSDVERLRAAHEAHNDRVRARGNAIMAVNRRRPVILRELRTISADVRALAAIIFRSEPELVRQFQLPKRRGPRGRSSRTPPTAPTPT